MADSLLTRVVNTGPGTGPLWRQSGTVMASRLVHKASSSYRVKGLMAAPVTPMNQNEEIDLAKIGPYVDHFLEYGVPNAFVCGTTGEGKNMSIAERKQVAEAWVREGKGKLSSIMVHIGAGNTKDSMELAKHAEEIGADSICCIAPTFFKPLNTDDYVEYMRRVAAAAPNTPFMLYDNVNYTGIKLDLNDFLHKGRKVIPTLAGVKHTTQDFPSMHLCHLDHDEAGIQVIMGTNEFLLEGLAVGLSTAVMNTYAGKVMNRIIDAFERQDLETARLEQGRLVRLGRIRKIRGLGAPEGTKVFLKAMGLDMGPCRCPVPKITSEEEAAIKKEMEEIGFFDWGTK